MKKEIKGALAAAVLLSALILTSCGDNGEMTLSRLEAQNADEAGSPPSMPDDGSTQNESDPAAGVSSPDSVISDPLQPEVIVVYVCGCVRNPGVYELPAGSRVCDGLDAAGGFSEGADEKRINLAGMLKDGDMVFFPEVGEALAEGAS
ncbi:MAG: SLBB domain-containing protein, partial [Lachnospiraceae bacterium]|nr:SLBB domain-containing protein [Lachnospiraceae bacterium]